MFSKHQTTLAMDIMLIDPIIEKSKVVFNGLTFHIYRVRKEGRGGKELHYKPEISDLGSAKRSKISTLPLNHNIYASITKTVYLNKLLIVRLVYWKNQNSGHSHISN